MKSKYVEAWNFMEVYIIYTTNYVCKQRVVALLLMELLSKMRKMRTITPPDAISTKIPAIWASECCHNVLSSYLIRVNLWRKEMK